MVDQPTETTKDTVSSFVEELASKLQTEEKERMLKAQEEWLETLDKQLQELGSQTVRRRAEFLNLKDQLAHLRSARAEDLREQAAVYLAALEKYERKIHNAEARAKAKSVTQQRVAEQISQIDAEEQKIIEKGMPNWRVEIIRILKEAIRRKETEVTVPVRAKAGPAEAEARRREAAVIAGQLGLKLSENPKLVIGPTKKYIRVLLERAEKAAELEREKTPAPAPTAVEGKERATVLDRIKTEARQRLDFALVRLSPLVTSPGEAGEQARSLQKMTQAFAAGLASLGSDFASKILAAVAEIEKGTEELANLHIKDQKEKNLQAAERARLEAELKRREAELKQKEEKDGRQSFIAEVKKEKVGETGEKKPTTVEPESTSSKTAEEKEFESLGKRLEEAGDRFEQIRKRKGELPEAVRNRVSESGTEINVKAREILGLGRAAEKLLAEKKTVELETTMGIIENKLDEFENFLNELIRTAEAAAPAPTSVPDTTRPAPAEPAQPASPPAKDADDFMASSEGVTAEQILAGYGAAIGKPAAGAPTPMEASSVGARGPERPVSRAGVRGPERRVAAVQPAEPAPRPTAAERPAVAEPALIREAPRAPAPAPAAPEKKGLWARMKEKAKSIFNKEVGKTILKVGYESIATVTSVKTLTDIAGRIVGKGDWAEYWKGRKGTKEEREQINGLFSELMAAIEARRVERAAIAGLTKEKTNKHLQLVAKIKEYKQAIASANYLNPQEKQEFLKKLGEIIKINDEQTEAAKKDRAEQTKEAVQAYIQNKVSGIKVVRDAINTVLGFTPFVGTRAVLFGGLSMLERAGKADVKYTKATLGRQAEQRSWGKRQWEVFKDVFYRAAVETSHELIGQAFKKDVSAKQRVIGSLKALGTLARGIGVYGLAFSGSETMEQGVAKFLDGIEKQGLLKTMGQNWLQNLERLYNVYRHPVDALHNALQRVGLMEKEGAVLASDHLPPESHAVRDIAPSPITPERALAEFQRAHPLFGNLHAMPGEKAGEIVIPLGKGAVMPHTEQVVRLLAEDAMKEGIFADGRISGVEGARSLNVGANLHELMQGHTVRGVDLKPEEVQKIISLEKPGREFQIVVHDRERLYRDIMPKLVEHANERILTASGGADEITRVRWERDAKLLFGTEEGSKMKSEIPFEPKSARPAAEVEGTKVTASMRATDAGVFIPGGESKAPGARGATVASPGRGTPLEPGWYGEAVAAEKISIPGGYSRQQYNDFKSWAFSPSSGGPLYEAVVPLQALSRSAAEGVARQFLADHPGQNLADPRLRADFVMFVEDQAILGGGAAPEAEGAEAAEAEEAEAAEGAVPPAEARPTGTELAAAAVEPTAEHPIVLIKGATLDTVNFRDPYAHTVHQVSLLGGYQAESSDDPNYLLIKKLPTTALDKTVEREARLEMRALGGPRSVPVAVVEETGGNKRVFRITADGKLAEIKKR